MNADIDALLRWRREERPAARVYGGLCVAPFHFRHFDGLLGDIGARRRRRSNVLAERFPYPNADAYGEFLASAPDYPGGIAGPRRSSAGRLSPFGSLGTVSRVG